MAVSIGRMSFQLFYNSVPTFLPFPRLVFLRLPSISFSSKGHVFNINHYWKPLGSVSKALRSATTKMVHKVYNFIIKTCPNVLGGWEPLSSQLGYPGRNQAVIHSGINICPTIYILVNWGQTQFVSFGVNFSTSMLWCQFFNRFG